MVIQNILDISQDSAHLIEINFCFTSDLFQTSFFRLGESFKKSTCPWCSLFVKCPFNISIFNKQMSFLTVTSSSIIGNKLFWSTECIKKSIQDINACWTTTISN